MHPKDCLAAAGSQLRSEWAKSCSLKTACRLRRRRRGSSNPFGKPGGATGSHNIGDTHVVMIHDPYLQTKQQKNLSSKHMIRFSAGVTLVDVLDANLVIK